MTDDPKRKPQKAAPATDKKGRAQKPKVKRVRKIGVLSILFLVLLTIIIVTITPVYSIALYFIPEQYKQVMLQGIHQTIILDESGTKKSEPFKYVPTEPLQVLGYKSGVCFSFFTDDASPINKRALKKAALEKPIADIIVIGNNRYEYSLKTTTIEDATNSNGRDISNICQIFGKDYPVVPKIIDKIYIRPLEPFTPIKAMWATTRDIRQN